ASEARSTGGTACAGRQRVVVRRRRGAGRGLGDHVRSGRRGRAGAARDDPGGGAAGGRGGVVGGAGRRAAGGHPAEGGPTVWNGTRRRRRVGREGRAGEEGVPPGRAGGPERQSRSPRSMQNSLPWGSARVTQPLPSGRVWSASW